MSPAPPWPHGPRTRVCVSVAETDMLALRDAFERIDAADLAEIRLDALDGHALDPGAFAEMIAACPVPAGFTLRPDWQGGGYAGSETERRRLLERAAEAGATFVDVELEAEWAADFINRARCPVVVSHHWLNAPPADLQEWAERARGLRASVVKLVGTASTPTDALPLLRVGLQLLREGQPATCFCMGEAGRASRLLAAAGGAALTYAAATGGREVASGQWPLRTLTEEMGVADWSPGSELFGLIGDPIEHSLSPGVFNAVFRRRGRRAAYLPVPGPDLDETLTVLQATGFRGVSVTMPFKEQMAARCARRDAIVEATGATNTVVFEADGWAAFNTDGMAVVEALTDVRDVAGARAVIVGAGGAARAAVVALAQAGAEVTVVNRTPGRAADAAAPAGARSGPVDIIGEQAFDVIINATPVGMDAGAAAEAGRTPFPVSWLRGDELVLDMIYRPRRTALLRAAEELGCATVEGLEMFVRQAAAQYRLLTGDRGFDPLETIRGAAAAILSHDRGADDQADAQTTSPDGTNRV